MWTALGAVLVSWFPLFLLSAAQGLAFGKETPIPFVLDFGVSVRFLIAVPLLILAETGIDRSIAIAVDNFLQSGLVQEDELSSFEAVIERITRLRDRILPEAVILVLAYLPSFFLFSSEILMTSASSWRFVEQQTLSRAEWWFGLFSMPVYRFLLLQWVWRACLWAFFLWRVSKLNLVLIPIHPDRAGGIGFLADAQSSFWLIAVAGGVVVAGELGNGIAYHGVTVNEALLTIACYCVIATLALISPLLLLTPKLLRVKEQGLLEYGALASIYTQTLDVKLAYCGASEGEALLGSLELRSLADLRTVFALVERMRVVPIDKRTLIRLAFAVVLPIALLLFLATPHFIRTVLAF